MPYNYRAQQQSQARADASRRMSQARIDASNRSRLQMDQLRMLQQNRQRRLARQRSAEQPQAWTDGGTSWPTQAPVRRRRHSLAWWFFNLIPGPIALLVYLNHERVQLWIDQLKTMIDSHR